jgi:hypothetical protein
MEERKRTTAEISKLSEAAEQMKLKLRKVDEQLESLQKENEVLSHFKNDVEERRQNCREAQVQTKEGCADIEGAFVQNKLLTLENSQIKRDIQVLLESYDTYKADAAKYQAKQEHAITELHADLEQQAEAHQ